MQRYIGTKLIQATPMTRLMYNEYRGWTLPEGEEGSDPGYLVEYLDGGPRNDIRHDGYISWSPEDVFNQTYRPVEGLSFSLALEALKTGKRVARKGWNGKDMWLSLSCNHSRQVPATQLWSPHNAAFAVSQGGTATVLPSITMKTASGEILMGWLASQTDMLSDDWVVLDD